MLLYKQQKSLPIADKDSMLYYICSKEAGAIVQLSSQDIFLPIFL